MKLQFNLTDSRYDLERFASRRELEDLLTGFDGIELMHLEEDEAGIIPPDMINGYHMTQPEYWMDFRRGDLKKCLAEFDTMENIRTYYGGDSPDVLVRKIAAEYENALSYGAEYIVIHVSDAGIFEEITGKYKYTDEEVIDGFCELVNEAIPADEPAAVSGNRSGNRSENSPKSIPWLLMENLWQPGLTFRDPQITARLMEKIRYPKKGIMLDTGHLMHTEPDLRTQKEAVRFIHRCLDEHGDLCRFIKGIHLNQSLTGPLMKKYMKDPPVPAKKYEERVNQLFEYIFRIDLHRPFVGEGTAGLIDRISPEYVTYEFISENLEEHKKMLKRQQSVLLQQRRGNKKTYSHCPSICRIQS